MRLTWFLFIWSLYKDLGIILCTYFFDYTCIIDSLLKIYIPILLYECFGWDEEVICFAVGCINNGEASAVCFGSGAAIFVKL